MAVGKLVYDILGIYSGIIIASAIMSWLVAFGVVNVRNQFIRVVVDLLYRPSVTPLQRSARAAGASAFGGLGLLLHQAALSFELWTGREPPLDAMSAAALAALA